MEWRAGLEHRAGRAIARFSGKIELESEGRPLRQKRCVARICGTLVLRMPSRVGSGERQLAAGARISRAAAWGSGVERISLRSISSAGEAGGSGGGAGVGATFG